MQVIVVILIALFLNGSGLGQQDKLPDSGQDTELGTQITKQQLLELPRRDKAPQITLRQALKIAENFIEKEKIDISSCYLFEAKWVSDKLDKEPSWRFWWVSVHGDRASDKDIKIIVSRDGKPQLKL